jgi:hypothetical protein
VQTEGKDGAAEMPFDRRKQTEACPVCTSNANIVQRGNRPFGQPAVVDCSQCGDFQVPQGVVDDLGLPFAESKMQALASYTIRKMQTPAAPRPSLTMQFFRAVESRTLPTPSEASDNLMQWLAEKADGRPGARLELNYSDPELLSTIGVVAPDDARWIVGSLASRGMILTSQASLHNSELWQGHLTAEGWTRFEDLKRAHVASKYAFFARQFSNPDLDELFDTCLRKAVAETGYELRTATQRAGLVDALIEDEVRRCRFVIADLSDDNAGAYWEAGFAEGLGKDVIYICRATDQSGKEKGTHFDTNHRHTVRWDVAQPERTAAQLKAVIRNTLLGDANQSD